jgi:hypothetical protein
MSSDEPLAEEAGPPRDEDAAAAERLPGRRAVLDHVVEVGPRQEVRPARHDQTPQNRRIVSAT